MIIRSFLFYTYLALWTLIFGIACSPLLIVKNRYLFKSCRIWARLCLFGLKHICGITYKVIGLENLPDSPYILASKHQSAFETIFFWTIIDKPAYILKRELIFLPVFGQYLVRLGMIYINRKAGASALKNIIRNSKNALENNSVIIIFPEGTRTKPGHYTEKYHSGIEAIYNNNKVQVVPVALNSGMCWPGKDFALHPGVITIKILEPFEPGIDKASFSSKLNLNIEEESLNLYKNKSTLSR